MATITDGLLSKIQVLPKEIIDIIEGYLPISVRILLNKKQYSLHHPVVYYAAGDSYVRHIVRDDQYFVFEQIAKERKKQWKYQKKYKYKNNNEGETFAAMEAAAPTHPDIKARVDMFRYRVPQEFYDLQKDPFSTNNLIHVPEYQETIKKYQERLRRWMVDTHDFCLAAFDVREDPAKLAASVANYPELKGPIVSDDEKDPSSASAPADDKTTKRKANRAAKKNAP